MEKLIEFWRRLEFNSPNYIHCDDKDIIADDRIADFKNYDQYLDSNSPGSDIKSLQVNLLPIPYVGNLREAKIFLLLLNPGFIVQDYYAESNSHELVLALQNNIRQEGISDDYPFLFLDPQYLWHPGGIYWLKHLNKYVIEVMKQKQKTYRQALSYVSSKVAVLEIVPYHSKSFGYHNLAKDLESAKKMKRFVQDYLQPLAKDGKLCIICTRKVKEWGLDEKVENENIVIYPPKYARSANISFGSLAAKVICKFLKIKDVEKKGGEKLME